MPEGSRVGCSEGAIDTDGEFEGAKEVVGSLLEEGAELSVGDKDGVVLGKLLGDIVGEKLGT